MRYKTTSVRRTLMDGIKQDKLVLSRHLNVITWFELSVFHMIFFHTHKGSVSIRFRIAVTVTENLFLFLVFCHARNIVFFYFLYRFLDLSTFTSHFFTYR